MKRGYYLSAEYLIGRHMQWLDCPVTCNVTHFSYTLAFVYADLWRNAIANLDLEQPFKDRPCGCSESKICFLSLFQEAFQSLGMELEDLPPVAVCLIGWTVCFGFCSST